MHNFRKFIFNHSISNNKKNSTKIINNHADNNVKTTDLSLTLDHLSENMKEKITKLLSKIMEKNNTDYFGIDTIFLPYYKNILGRRHFTDKQIVEYHNNYGIQQKIEYVYKNFNCYYYDNHNNLESTLNICDLYDNYCKYGYDKKKSCNINDYNLIDTKQKNYVDSSYIFEFVKTNCLDQLKKKYYFDYNVKIDIIPLLYYCENSITGKNFLLEYSFNETLTKDYDYVHFTLDLIFSELKKNNIEWKYFVFTDEPIVIEQVLLTHNIFTIYKITPTQKNNIIFSNPNTTTNNDVWITTHQRLFIENIYKKKFRSLNIECKQNSENMAYVLTINEQRYKLFLQNSRNKKIDMSFIKVNGIDKKIFGKNKKSNINLGHVACGIGHYLILKLSFNTNNPKNILIMEDDNDFNINFNNRWNIIRNYLDNNLDEWEIFNGNCCLAIYPYDFMLINNEKIIKYTNNTKTNFIYYNQKVIPKIINYFDTFYFNMIDNIRNNDWIIDRFFRIFTCVTTIPFLTNEIPGTFSNIDNGFQSYSRATKVVENDVMKIINATETHTHLDIIFYRKSYSDLRKFSDKYLKLHWNNYGKKENRLPNYNVFLRKFPDFDIKTYRKNNVNLSHLTDNELISYYWHHDCAENRTCRNNNESLILNDRKLLVPIDNQSKVYTEQMTEKTNNNNKEILLVLDDYKKNGLENYTKILEKKLNADVRVIEKSDTVEYDNNIFDGYKIILFQNTFFEIKQKSNQICIYVVHNQCDQWNNDQINIVKNNNKFMDIYVFVSESIKQKFESNILIPNNSFVIENQIEPIENNKKEIDGLFVSYGAYTEISGYLELIQKFSGLDINKYKLEVYGNIRDVSYYDELQKMINENNLYNIKLFTLTDEYLERLKEAEYFCSFGENEDYSYSILEAMILNKKIICNSQCLVTEFMKKYENVIGHTFACDWNKQKKINDNKKIEINFNSFVNKYKIITHPKKYNANIFYHFFYMGGGETFLNKLISQDERFNDSIVYCSNRQEYYTCFEKINKSITLYKDCNELKKYLKFNKIIIDNQLYWNELENYEDIYKSFSVATLVHGREIIDNKNIQQNLISHIPNLEKSIMKSISFCNLLNFEPIGFKNNCMTNKVFNIAIIGHVNNYKIPQDSWPILKNITSEKNNILHIIGCYNNPIFKKYYEQLVDFLKSDNVFFYGMLPQSEVNDLLFNKINVVLHLSVNEMGSYTLINAQRCGIPVICRNTDTLSYLNAINTNLYSKYTDIIEIINNNKINLSNYSQDCSRYILNRTSLNINTTFIDCHEYLLQCYDENIIPQISHVVFGLKKQTEEFSYVYYLAIRSFIFYNKPKYVFFWYIYEPYGRYWALIKQFLILNKIDENYIFSIGNKIAHKYAHKADLIRMEVLKKYGGIYFDIDTITYKPFDSIDGFYNYDFYIGIQERNWNNNGRSKNIELLLCNAIMACKKESFFINKWMKMYEQNFNPNGWCEASVLLPGIIYSGLSKTEKDNIFLANEDMMLKPTYTETSMIFESEHEINKNLIMLHHWNTFSNKYYKDINLNYHNTSNTMYAKIVKHFYERLNDIKIDLPEYALFDTTSYDYKLTEFYDVSIIMPYYYTKKEIFHKAILSVINQRNLFYMNVEVVLIDDGTYECINYVNELKSKDIFAHMLHFIKFKIVELKKNVGVSKAIQIGIDNASHDIIFRFDVDDIMHPDRIGYQLFVYENTRKKLGNNKFILSNHFKVFFDDLKTQTYEKRPGLKNMAELIYDINNACHLWYVCHPSVMFNKKCVCSKYPDNCKNLCEDLILWIYNAANNVQIIYDPVILHLYRQNNNNISIKNNEIFNKWKENFVDFVKCNMSDKISDKIIEDFDKKYFKTAQENNICYINQIIAI